MNSNTPRPNSDPRMAQGQAPAQRPAQGTPGPRPAPGTHTPPQRPQPTPGTGRAPSSPRPGMPQGTHQARPTQPTRPVHPRPQPNQPTRPDGPSGQQPPHRRPPLTPEQRAAREQARKRRKQQAQIKGALTLGALALVLIFLITGIAKCAIGSGTPGNAETSSGAPVSDPVETPTESTAEPDETKEPQSSASPESAPGTSAPVTDPPATSAPVTPPPTVSFTLPEAVESRYILLVNRTTGQVIFEKNADATAYPASITKVMTVLVALEELSDENGEVTITQDLIDRLKARGAARAGFFPGEKVKAKDLMYAALLPSGADGSVGLAELVAGSEEDFAALMNRKAKELGMNNTRFVNATGLHEDDHYSSCRDLYLLLDEALKNETLRTIFTTDSYRTDPTNIHDAGIWMRSTMFRYLEEEKIERDYFLGGKTGYTGQAGVCLASLSKYDGNEYVLITLGAGNGDNHPRYQVHDAVLILDAYFQALG